MTDRNEKRSAAEESISGIRLYTLMFTMSYVSVSLLLSVVYVALNNATE